MRLAAPLAAALSFLVLLSAPPARADDAAAADALFQQAKALTDKQQWAEACPKFEASYRLDKTLGTLLNLADCEEHVDRIAAAWAHWGEAVELAEKAGDKRAEYAGKRRAAIKDRVPKIQLDVSAGKSALAVLRDGVRIDPAAYGVPLPSDPGSHTITVRRGDETLVEKKIDARERETAALKLDLEAIERAAPPPASSVRRKAGWGVLGSGVGLVALAGGLEIGALVTKSRTGAAGACVQGLCTPTGFGTVNRARALANAGQWIGIGGILVTAVGITLVATAPGQDAGKPRSGKSAAAERPAALTVSPWAGPGGVGITFGGAL